MRQTKGTIVGLHNHLQDDYALTLRKNDGNIQLMTIPESTARLLAKHFYTKEDAMIFQGKEVYIVVNQYDMVVSMVPAEKATSKLITQYKRRT